jgi:hypothetical protein
MIGVLTEKESKEVLRNNLLGRIGCSSHGTSYIVPINYLYDGTSIIGHSQVGMKVKMMRDNPEVCFEVDEILSFKSWKSVIAWGTYQEITDDAEKEKVLKAFVEHLMPAKISETAQPPETSEMRRHPQSDVKVIVYRIVIKKITGRFERDD